MGPHRLKVSAAGINRAVDAYGFALKGLWIGNGAAAIALIGLIGTTWQGGHFAAPLIWPLICFAGALISMAIGAAASLRKQARIIRTMEDVRSVWNLPMDSIQRPSEEAGLTIIDWRTRTALIAAALFSIGCVWGFFELLQLS